MLSIFTTLADWLVYSLFGLTPDTKLGDALHFFVEDTSKIFVLLIVMIYCIALIRASLNVERVRAYLAKRNKFLGYVMGSVFGAVTPFCSCSQVLSFRSTSRSTNWSNRAGSSCNQAATIFHDTRPGLLPLPLAG